MDYKEQWQEYYEDALERGWLKSTAESYADSELADSQAEAIDRGMEDRNE